VLLLTSLQSTTSVGTVIALKLMLPPNPICLKK
jgi:hypothetical protein